MTMEIKYRHPEDSKLEWSGKGRQPKWVEHALENGFIEADLLVDYQKHVATQVSDIDLGIGQVVDVETLNQNVLLTKLTDSINADAIGGELVVAGEVPCNRALVLAKQLGYDGPLTVGCLEDGIRVYQRRTVEDCLELGKYLLLLKELTPHGEFAQRIELLGIPERTARRFSQAAAKVSQNGHLADLSKRVKSLSAILELVTADDEVLEDISTMDDIDRLSTSQLRERLRNSEHSINRLQSDLNTASSRLCAEAKTLPPPLLSREVDKQLMAALNAEAMGAAALDLLNRQIGELAGGGDYLAEQAATLHSCLCALASRVSIAFEALDAAAADYEIKLPARPRMVVSEGMARDYLEAHTGYINTAIELAQKALIARGDVIGRGRGRLPGSKNKRKAEAA